MHASVLLLARHVFNIKMKICVSQGGLLSVRNGRMIKCADRKDGKLEQNFKATRFR